MQHMGPLDAGFAMIEDENVALHIGAVAVFDGPVPEQDEIERRYRARVASLPRYRERPVPVPLGLSWPVWVEVAELDLDEHLHRAALPAPGDRAQLDELVGELMSAPLDPARPPWETWVVEGLERGRWALVTKIHHGMADGISGLQLFTAVFDPPPGHPAPHRLPRARPRRAGPAALLGAGIGDRLDDVRGLGRTLAGHARHPRRFAGRVTRTVRGSWSLARAVRPVPASSLVGPLGPVRSYRTVEVDIARASRLRHELGGSLNDVVLSPVTLGLRALLLARDEKPVAGAARCLVPVSTRRDGDGVGNRVSALLLDLPVDFADAAAAHGAVVARTRELKASDEAEAGETLLGLMQVLPPGVVRSALAGVLHLPHRVLTTVVTDVPGPRLPLLLLGRRMVALSPYVPIADTIRVGVAVVSYAGVLSLGVTADRDSCPDIDVAVTAMGRGLDELDDAAEALRRARA